MSASSVAVTSAALVELTLIGVGGFSARYAFYLGRTRSLSTQALLFQCLGIGLGLFLTAAALLAVGAFVLLPTPWAFDHAAAFRRMTLLPGVRDVVLVAVAFGAAWGLRERIRDVRHVKRLALRGDFLALQDALVLQLAKEGGGRLDQFVLRHMPFSRSRDSRPAVELTMESGKVYAGWVIDFDEPKDGVDRGSRFLRLLPIRSGYRRRRDLKVVFTTNYEPVLRARAGRRVSEEEWAVLLPLASIVSARAWQLEAYEAFQELAPPTAG